MLKIQLLNTPHAQHRCRQTGDGCQCGAIWLALSIYRKKWHAYFRDRGWGRLRYLPRGDMATEATIALDSRFNLRLMTRILVVKDMNCLCHVMIEVNGGCVCCWHQLPHVMSHPCMMLGNHEAASQLIAQRVETIHVEVNITHPSIINPLIEQSLWKCHNYNDLQHKPDEISSGNYKPGMLIWLKGSTGRCNSQTFICFQQ